MQLSSGLLAGQKPERQVLERNVANFGQQLKVHMGILHGYVLPLPVGLIVIGILIRLTLAPYTSWSSDVAVWFHTSMSGFYGLHLYDRPGFSYPPVWGYMLQILGWIVHVAGGRPTFFSVVNPDLSNASSTTADFSSIVTSPAYNLLFKSILGGFDLATALVIRQFVLFAARDRCRADLAMMAWFLNPYVIYASAVQGASDTIVGFSVLAAVVLVLLHRPLVGGVAWAIGVLTKLIPAVLVAELVLGLVLSRRSRNRPIRFRMAQVALFGLGAVIASLLILAPESLFGSAQAIIFNTFHRTREPAIIGGLSLTGVRHLKQWSWLFGWAYQHSGIVFLASSIAQAVAVVGWGVWAFVLLPRSAVFGLLTGTVGALASVMLLAPLGQPTYVLWWLPVLIVLVFLTGGGRLHLAVLSVAPLVFSVGILGPTAYLAPLSTYTHVISASTVSSGVVSWYLAPGRLWGATLGDDFMAPAALATVATLMSLFAMWLRAVISRQEPQIRLPSRA
jgi:hypothetical protein